MELKCWLDFQSLPAAVAQNERGPGVYVLRSQRDGRCYVGSASNLTKRLSRHIGESQIPDMRRVIERDGPAAFLCCLFPCTSTSAARTLEAALIRILRTDSSVHGRRSGFNRNGDGVFGNSQTAPVQLEVPKKPGRPRGSRTSDAGRRNMSVAQVERRKRERVADAAGDC